MSDDLTPDNLPGKVQPRKDLDDEIRDEEQAAEFAVTEEEAQRAMAFFRDEQNLVMGAAYGLIAAVAGAAAWAGITVASGYQIGWMAVAIGFLVGIAVRLGGKGVDPAFGFVGALLSLVGCVLGNLFTVAWYYAQDAGMSVLGVLAILDFEMAYGLMRALFNPMDLLFYGLALYFGYRNAFRELSRDDFSRALGRAM